MNTAVGRCPSHAERRVDSIIHIAGVLCAGAGTLWLLLNVSTSTRLSIAVYCLGLLTTISSSMLYHGVRQGALKGHLRRVDHASIFIMIAGTYTPLAANLLGAGLGALVLTGIWLWAAAGVIWKLVWPNRLEAAGVWFYLGMGWTVLLLVEPLSLAMSFSGLLLLIAGGSAYSLGVVFHLLRRLPFHNAIWHGLVLAGAGLHFGAMAREFTR